MGNSIAAGASCTIVVQFNPTANQAPGLATALLTLSDNAQPATQTVSLTGISVTAPLTTASLSASALAFGNQQLSTSSATQTVTVTNTGTLPLVIYHGAITLSGANASQFAIVNTGTCVAGNGVTVAAGASCTIDVQFKPTSVVGANSATMNIVDNTAASAQTVSLTGTSTASGLSVSLTSPAANATTTAPGSFTLTAAATDSSGTIARVDYYANGQLLGTATASPYSYTWTIDSSVASGVYSLTAVATDNNNLTATSAAVNVTVNSTTPQAYYIHTDQLDTPRQITDTNGNVVWQWDNNDPFGNNMANENPNGAGTTFNFNLRFPGQYYDRETNLHYNVNRDYDPSIGRYVESDPIGLQGGINTYGYALQNPLRYTDPSGLIAGVDDAIVIGGVIIVGAAMSTPQGQAATRQIANAIKEFCDPGCATLEAQIAELAGELRTRYVQMTADTNNLFCTRPIGQFSWMGHVLQYNQKQKRLQGLIAQAKAKGCAVNPEDERLASTPPPSCPAR